MEIDYATKLKLWVIGYLLLAGAGTLRVDITQRDTMQQSVDAGLLPASQLRGCTAGCGRVWERAWIWQLGEQSDGSVVQMEWLRTVIVEGLIFGFCYFQRSLVVGAMWTVFRPWLVDYSSPEIR